MLLLYQMVLTKLCVVSGTFSKTSTCNSSPVSHEMSVSQPIGFFSLKQEGDIKGNSQHLILLFCECNCFSEEKLAKLQQKVKKLRIRTETQFMYEM